MSLRAMAIGIVGWLVVLGAPPDAARAQSCDASALCPGAGPCTIAGTHNLTPDCLLDFGAKAVTVNGVLQADVDGTSFEIRAGSLQLAGGKLRSLGTSTQSGGSITVLVTGAFSMTGSGPLVDTSAGGGGGQIDITAASMSIAAGNIRSNGGLSEENCGDGDTVNLTATGPIVIDGNVEATTPGYHCAGGDITVTAASIEVNGTVDVSGGDLPFGLTLTATSGDIVVSSTGFVGASGKGSDGDGSGASGSSIDIAAAGDVILSGDVEATGSGPDGDGGEVTIDAGGDVQVAADVDVRGNGTFSTGGDIAITAAGDLTITAAARLRADAADGGGSIDLEAGSDIVSDAITIDAGGAAGGGGDISIDAVGVADLAGTIDAAATGGGTAGSVTIFGCHVDFQGLVDMGASGGGTAVAFAIDVIAGTITVRSTADLLAVPCPGNDCIRFTLRSGSPVLEPGSVANPPPLIEIDPELDVCCGNGDVEAWEGCDDGNRLSCDGCTGSCEAEPSPACPPDGNECTLDCNPISGCAYSPLTDVPCSDEPGGNACTEDVCQAGTCAHPPITCDDGIACTVDACDPGSGCTVTPDDAACDDGTTCTSEVCNPASGCEYDEEPDGTACSDGDFCTTGDRCEAGACVSTGALNCDDGNPCTDDSCSAGLACLNLENDLCPCSVEGEPLPAGTACAEGNNCTLGDTCDGAGTCVAGSGCDDGDPCTLDGCFLICVHLDNQCPTDCTGQPDGTPCSDGLLCTDQSCQGGACASEPTVCGDADPCNGSDLCVEARGCQETAPPVEDPACEGIDSFTCYKAKVAKGAPPFVPIPSLPIEDAFEALSVTVKKPMALCNPTDVSGGDPGAPAHEDHLQAFDVKKVPGTPAFAKRLGLVVTDAFGTLTIDAIKRERLLAPAAVDLVAPPAAPIPPDPDHFECYKAKVTKGTQAFTPVLGLPITDGFGSLTVDLKGPSRICLPASKDGDDPSAPTHPAHLLCYKARTSRGTPKLVPQLGVHVTTDLAAVQVDAKTLEEVCVPATLAP